METPRPLLRGQLFHLASLVRQKRKKREKELRNLKPFPGQNLAEFRRFELHKQNQVRMGLELEKNLLLMMRDAPKESSSPTRY